MFMNRKTCYCQDVSFSQPDRFDTISVKIPASYIFGYQQTDSKVCMERQKSQKSQPKLEEEEQSHGPVCAQHPNLL